MSDSNAAAAEAVNPATQPEAAVEKANGKSDDSPSEQQTEKLNGNAEERSKNGYDRDQRRDNRRGGRGSHFRNKPRNNNEFANLPESDDPVEIREQVEFYLSPQNLCSDRHMFLTTEGPNNKPVEIKHIHTFKRMRRFQPYSAVVNALRESKDLVVVDDGQFSGPGNEAVKRKEPIEVPTEKGDDENKPTIEELYWRLNKQSENKLEACIYAKGFGDLEDASQIEIEKFFKPYGAIMTRKRFDQETGRWKGSVFVEFDTVENQEQFLALDPKPKFNGNELTIMGKKEYSEMKCKEKGIEPAWKNGGEYNSSRGNRGGRGRGRGRGGRGGRGGFNDRRDNRSRRDRSPRRRRDRSDSEDEGDKDDWNSRRDRFQSRSKAEQSESKGIDRDAHGVPVVKDTRTEAEKDASNKRKADEADREEGSKKSKLEFKEDE